MHKDFASLTLIENFISQNITRDIEVKNNLTMVRGCGEGTVRRGDYRNYYKGHMHKIKGSVEVRDRSGFSWGGLE